MNAANLISKAEHFEELASRAAYNAAVAVCEYDRDNWLDREARYDARATEYRRAVRVAA